MNHTTRQSPVIVKAAMLFACFVSALLVNYASAGDLRHKEKIGTEVAVVFKQSGQDKQQLTISLTAAAQTNGHLFIFSADGLLMNDLFVTTTSAKTIKGLARGYYTYELFKNDQRLKSGMIVLE